jgi:hypothetical protein
MLNVQFMPYPTRRQCCECFIFPQRLIYDESYLSS